MRLFITACVVTTLTLCAVAIYRTALTLWVLFHLCQGSGCQ